MKMKKICGFLILYLVKMVWTQSPYANDFDYQKYGFDAGFSTGRTQADSNADQDVSGFLKNRMRIGDGNRKAIADAGQTFNLEKAQNGHELAQSKKGSTVDNLTHVQGEDFETDKSHKRKHVKSGFQNSYHKEENGSKSSWYEDSDDKGGKVIYDKRHGTRGDQHDNIYTEGSRAGLVRDKYDDRTAGFDNRDMHDRHQDFAQDHGKQHGYRGGYRGGMEEGFDSRRMPAPPLVNRYYEDRRDYDRYDPRSHWGYNPRLPPPPLPLPVPARPNNDFYTRRQRITIFEDPRDDFEARDRDRDRFRDGGNFITRSDITRRQSYDTSTPLRLRYRGI